MRDEKLSNYGYTICYQSKVGRKKWLEPSTEIVIQNCGKNSLPVAVIPIAFVSEHSETLVELDIEYKEVADDYNVPIYSRVPTLSLNEHFISCLANVCLHKKCTMKRCPNSYKRCFKSLCPQ